MAEGASPVPSLSSMNAWSQRNPCYGVIARILLWQKDNLWNRPLSIRDCLTKI